MPNQISCPEKCNVLLIGGGGREHALAWKMSQSPRLGVLYSTDCSNGGIALLAKPCEESWNPSRAFFLKRWCEKHEIHLVVVGPEVPLSEGIVDVLSSETLVVFGPSKDAARIESDKSYAKELMRQASIPSPDSRAFTDFDAARRYLLRGLDRELENDHKQDLSDEVVRFMECCDRDNREGKIEFSDALMKLLHAREEPCVVKASGLAAGKGVIICQTVGDTLDAIERIMEDRVFGDAGGKILIEEYMSGQEISVLALVDGGTIWILDLCQDHKQLGVGDVGPNTGGMGAYCPATLIDEDLLEYIEREILVPAVDAMRRDGILYRGVLYAGLMLTTAGPKVLEFNCRFGDPETQPLMVRFKGDLIEVLWRTAVGTLDGASIQFEENVSCCVVMCSEGYPNSYEKGYPITGIQEAESTGEVQVFHAGTDCTTGELKTSGGRVLGITSIASDLDTARTLANAACEKIHFEGAFWRHDIGCRSKQSQENAATCDSGFGA